MKAADAIFVKAGLDWDDGRTEYEVEFYAGNTEYDYSIDATTGAIAPMTMTGMISPCGIPETTPPTLPPLAPPPTI